MDAPLKDNTVAGFTMPGSVVIRLTVYADAVKVEVDEFTRTRTIGWFRDEVAALSAVCERSLMRSAILPELRRLPQLAVFTEYKPGCCAHEPEAFRRAVTVRCGDLGRRVVLLPNAHAKGWLAM